MLASISIAQPLVLGVSNGAALGLVAIGLVLIYKSSRVFNFAAGEFMTLGAYGTYVGASILKLPYPVAILMGLAFVGYTVKDFRDLHFGWRDHAYGSIFYVIVGLHATHVVVGLLMSLVVQVKAWQRKFTAARHVTVEVFSLYWHFVDAVWLFVFPSLFLSAHIR